jgi:drug/metabolite transporter (DMT)-like permease
VSPPEIALPRVAPLEGYAGVALAAAGWGTWCIFLRRAQATGSVPPELSSFVVLTTIAIVLCPLAVQATRRRVRAPTREEYGLLAAFGVSDALNCMLYFGALQATSVAVAVLTHYAAPLLVALGAPSILREPRRPGTFGSVLLGLLGLTLLLAPWHGATRLDAGLWKGAALGLGSAIFYAAGVLFNKRLGRSFDACELLVYHMPSALLLLAALVPHGSWSLSGAAWFWLILGALGPGALAGILFIRGLRQVPAAHASVLTLVEPFTALCIALFAWGEPLEPTGLAGGAAILYAGYRVVRTDRGASLDNTTLGA